MSGLLLLVTVIAGCVTVGPDGEYARKIFCRVTLGGAVALAVLTFVLKGLPPTHSAHQLKPVRIVAIILAGAMTLVLLICLVG